MPGSMPVSICQCGCGMPKKSRKGRYLRGHNRRPSELSVEDRFWSKIDQDGPPPGNRPELGACWLWTAGLVDGYGQFTVRHLHQVQAHRYAYELLIGPIPTGLELDHLCRTTRCVNPNHLDPVTHQENVRRGVSPAAVNARKTHCGNGHEYTPENTIVTSEGYRRCRTCRRRQRAEHRARRRLFDGGSAA